MYSSNMVPKHDNRNLYRVIKRENIGGNEDVGKMTRVPRNQGAPRLVQQNEEGFTTGWIDATYRIEAEGTNRLGLRNKCAIKRREAAGIRHRRQRQCGKND